MLGATVCTLAAAPGRLSFSYFSSDPGSVTIPQAQSRSSSSNRHCKMEEGGRRTQQRVHCDSCWCCVLRQYDRILLPQPSPWPVRRLVGAAEVSRTPWTWSCFGHLASLLFLGMDLMGLSRVELRLSLSSGHDPSRGHRGGSGKQAYFTEPTRQQRSLRLDDTSQ